MILITQRCVERGIIIVQNCNDVCLIYILVLIFIHFPIVSMIQLLFCFVYCDENCPFNCVYIAIEPDFELQLQHKCTLITQSQKQTITYQISGQDDVATRIQTIV